MSTSSPRNGLTVVIAVALFLSLGLMLLMRGTSAPRWGGGMPVGETAPPIEAAGWINGEAPAMDDLRGKVVVVEAWATWCVPCRIKAPELVELHRKFEDQEVVFIGLTAEEEDSLPQIQRFLEDAEISWLNGYGATKTLFALGAEYIPAAWVIGPDGKVVWNEDSPGELEDGIRLALGRLNEAR